MRAQIVKFFHANHINPSYPSSKFFQHIHHLFPFQYQVTQAVIADPFF